MLRTKLRLLATTLVLASVASLTASIAAEPEAGLPPKAYEIPKRGISKDIRAAVESPTRDPAMKARDGYRRPAEILALAGLRPGQRVVEFGPWGWYYSTLISDVIGPKGELHMYEHPYIHEQIEGRGEQFAETRDNVHYYSVDLNTLELPRNVDVVFNVMSFQKMLLTNVEIERIHTTIFKALKPGGIYLVIEPAAVHGVGTDDIGRLRRIDPGVIRPYVTSQGFVLDEDSRMLENPQDDHKTEVFTDDAADVSDRIIYKFKKPVIY